MAFKNPILTFSLRFWLENDLNAYDWNEGCSRSLCARLFSGGCWRRSYLHCQWDMVRSSFLFLRLRNRLSYDPVIYKYHFLFVSVSFHTYKDKSNFNNDFYWTPPKQMIIMILSKLSMNAYLFTNTCDKYAVFQILATKQSNYRF